MKKRWSLWVAAVVMALVLSACGGTAPAEEAQGTITEPAVLGAEAPQTQTEEPKAGQPEGTVYPLTVTDASGTEVTLEKAPEKLISIAPSETEVLFAIGAGDRVVGVNDWSDYPAEAADLPKVGGFPVNIEKILELEPDLVVAGWTLNKADVEELRRLGITVYASEPKSIDEVLAHIREMGRIVNSVETAEQVAQKMENDRKLVADVAGNIAENEKKSVYIEFDVGWTVGKGTFMDELIAEAGGINIAGDQEGWYEISEEMIIEKNPQVILHGMYVPVEMISERAGWGQIDAIVNGRMNKVDDNLVSRPGPRITEGLVEVAKAIYPEKFN